MILTGVELDAHQAERNGELKQYRRDFFFWPVAVVLSAAVAIETEQHGVHN